MKQPKRIHIARSSKSTFKKHTRSPLFFLCILFLVGVTLGSVFATLGGNHPQFSDQFSTFAQSVSQGNAPKVSLCATIWEIICWPALLLLLAFGTPGIIGIPCVMLARGFLLSYACTSFVSMYGWHGIGWNAIFFGVSALLLVPVLVCVANWAFSCACHRSISPELPSITTPSWSMLVCCAALLTISFLLLWYFLPMWLPTLSRQLLTSICTPTFPCYLLNIMIQ